MCLISHENLLKVTAFTITWNMCFISSLACGFAHNIFNYLQRFAVDLNFIEMVDQSSHWSANSCAYFCWYFDQFTLIPLTKKKPFILFFALQKMSLIYISLYPKQSPALQAMMRKVGFSPILVRCKGTWVGFSTTSSDRRGDCILIWRTGVF